MGSTAFHTKWNLRRPRRIVRSPRRMFRLFFLLTLIFSFSVAVPANAIETVKASALIPEEVSADTSLSFTQKIPPRKTANTDPCLPLLGSVKPLSSRFNAPGRPDSRQNAGKTAAPVALGFVLGVRIALGPKEVMKNRKRVEIGPEIHTVSTGGINNRALAIAAYRSCKNEHALKQDGR
ncbi:MAG: hypothetical protein AAGB32_04835 [Pseudomonadota bacterium]